MAAQRDESSTTSAPADEVKQSTLQREAFFLSFAQTVRANFPKVVLIVSGGFRTRAGMESALQSGGCDLIGIARPAAVLPRLPKEIILNGNVKDDDAIIRLKPVALPKMYRYLGFLLPVKILGGKPNFYTKYAFWVELPELGSLHA